MTSNTKFARSSKWGATESNSMNSSYRDGSAAHWWDLYSAQQADHAAKGNRSDPTKNPPRPRMGGQPRNNGKGTVVVVRQPTASSKKVVVHQRTARPKTSKKSLADWIGVGPLSANVDGTQSFSAAVSYGKQSKMMSPSFANRSANTIRVKHRELVEPALLGSTTFALQETYVVNPGLASSFPWLSTMAATWQEYELHSLSYQYLTRVSTATAGSIMLSPDLDPTNPPPGNEVSTSNNPSTVEGPVWKDLKCNVNLSGAHNVKRRFVRNGPEVGDAHMFDALTMYVITNDCANTNPLGKIWVEYDISFYLPVVTPSDPISRGCCLFTNSVDQAIPMTTPTAVIFGTTVCNPFNIQYAAGLFTPPRGMYIIDYVFSYSDTTFPPILLLKILKNGVPMASSIELMSGSVQSIVNQASGFNCVSCSGTDTIQLSVESSNSANVIIFGSGGITSGLIKFTLC